MIAALVVLSVVALGLAGALIGQSIAFASERKALLEQFRAKARDDVRAQLATSALDYARAQGVEDAIVERERQYAAEKDEPPYEGFG